jgi:hypothetical protein
MADISNVQVGEIKDLYERLEGLSCKFPTPSPPRPKKRQKDAVLTLTTQPAS